MENSEKADVKKLINLLNNMYKIIALNSNNDVRYGKKNIVKMIAYLEEELSNGTMEYTELIDTVIEAYKSMFPPRGGLSDFHIWDNDYQIRYKANHEYEQIKEQIETILKVEK